ncbi:MAG: FecR family protein [Alphaproteobacteria bacterium]|nr:FecR family protein [Alphaproteobacteria bacterium]
MFLKIYASSIWRHALIVLACLVLPVAIDSAMAREHQSWMVARAEGNVRHGVDVNRMQPSLAGDRLAPGTAVSTGSDGRLTIIRGHDRIDAGPDTWFVVSGDPAMPPDGVGQRLGRMLFDMGNRASWNFRVDTPLLTVTIKGTRFTIDVSVSAESVSVDEGSVEVRARGTGDAVLVGPGFTASVDGINGSLEVRPTETQGGMNEPTDAAPPTDTALGGAVGDSLGGVAGAAADAAGAAADAARSSEKSVQDAVGGLADSLP